ncbi:MAG: hypothetical protein HY321_05665 [Armatimonadetes bacterium]|nr:hypothetical protein [Armatimonadota bacterium]
MSSMALIGLCSVPALVAPAPAFVDHGVGAPVAESRGVVAATDAAGRGLVVACSLDMGARGWILVTDVARKETRQYWFPEGVRNAAPYVSLLSANGRFYTAAGPILLEFDLDRREWTYQGVPCRAEGTYLGSALVDGPDGLIYAGGYPNCRLVSHNPKTREMVDYGQMDPAEHYFTYLAFDSAGWAYCGIGTARFNLVAFHPKTRERRQLLKEEERKLGTASVYRGVDGNAYGAAGDQWYRLFEGAAAPIAKEDAAPPAPTGTLPWGAARGSFPDGRVLKSYDLPQRRLVIEDPRKKQAEEIRFDYESGGAQITSLVAGPDGKVYGSSAHPMHFFSYDPGRGALEDLGPVRRVSGGNFCAMAVQGRHIAAPSYSGGIFHLFDTTRPFNGGFGDDPNPRELAQWKSDITRPRAALAHPDGRHVLMAGFAGYGMRGGGLGICDLESGQADLIRHTDLIPDQSTVTLKALPNGDLVGGTSVETPGGGHPTEMEGVLYLLDWKTRKVIYRTAPVPGARQVHSVEVGPDSLVYGLASGSRFFIFDPKSREVLHRDDLSQYGDPARPALAFGPDGGLHALFTKAIARIDPGTRRHEKVADAPGPVTAGLAIQGGRIYFAVGAHLWSCALP